MASSSHQATLSNLPNEVLLVVAGHLCNDGGTMTLSWSGDIRNVETLPSRSDIASLSFVSKKLNSIVNTILYERVYINTTKSLLLLCETLSRLPKLILLVHALSLNIFLHANVSCEDHSGPNRKWATEEQRRAGAVTLRAVAALLSRTVNLQHLRLLPIGCLDLNKPEYESSATYEGSDADSTNFIIG